MRPLNICIFQTNLPSERIRSGGEERFTIELARKLSERHRVHVLTRGPKNIEKTEGNLTIRKIRCTDVKGLRFLIYVLSLIWHFLRIRDVDLIQAHVSDRANGLAGVVASKLRGVPCITRVSGIDPIPMLPFWQKLLFRIIFRYSRYIISINSNMMVDDINRLWQGTGIAVLPHGIDMKGLSRPRKAAKSREKILLFVGRFVWFKNTAMLVDVMKVLLKRRKDVKLWVVAKDPGKSGMMSAVGESGLEKHVVFMGELWHEEVMKRMEQADIFVFPSVYEPRGLVVIEAMLKGLPVVAVNRGGPKDIITEGRNGFLVEPDEPEKMARQISRLLDDKELYETVSKNNIDDVQKYSWDSVADSFEHFYRNVLENRI